MKNAIIAILLMSFTAASYARTITCSIDKNVDYDLDGQFGVEEIVTGNCSKGHSFELRGIGLAAHISVLNKIAIQCPGVDNLRGTYYGADVKAKVLAGAEIGVFVSQDGLCLLGGLSALSLGAGVAVTRLKIQ